jgi:hypothetical protein
VASNLVAHLKENATIFGVDQYPSKNSDLKASIESFELKKCLSIFTE